MCLAPRWLHEVLGLQPWGSLGDGTNTNRASPVDVIGLTGATSIAAGGDVTCALDAVGGVDCWGWNNFGQVGDGTTIDRNTPVDVIGLSTVATSQWAASTHAH